MLDRIRFFSWLPWAMLLFLILATYAFFYAIPYPGFRWRSNGTIYAVYVEGAAAQQLQVGDQLVQVGDLSWDEYESDSWLQLFQGVQPGEIVPLSVLREGDAYPIGVDWRIPGPTELERWDRFKSQWLLPYVFWLAGTLTVLLLRPKDRRWALLVAFYYLTAAWLMLGTGLSHWRWWGSLVFLRILVWLSVPVYLHLHWIFPYPFRPMPGFVRPAGYGIALLLAGMELAQLLPGRAYQLGFAVALLASILLLIAHLFPKPLEKRESWFLIAGVLFAVLPSIVTIIIQAMRPNETITISAGLLFLSALPFSYFFAAYYRQFGTQEVRANRFVAFYLFMMLLGAVAMAAGILSGIDERTFLFYLFLTGFAVLLFEPFQRLIERYFLGMPLPPTGLVETYTTEIMTRFDRDSLMELLHQQLLPTLLVREAALLPEVNGGAPTPPVTLGIKENELPPQEHLGNLLEEAGRYRHPDRLEPTDPAPWVRLVLPLEVNEERLGTWLLGKRDPDDFYGQAEIETFQALANQTALALTNIIQADELRTLYRTSADREAAERARIARELHDNVLSQMAELRLMKNDAEFVPQFLARYETLVDTIRQVISDLRPVVLMLYGLHQALKVLTSGLDERLEGSGPEMRVELPDTMLRYPPGVEEQLYNIVKQGLENALRHAHAKTLTVQGEFREDGVDLQVVDDGVGFTRADHASLLEGNHFGLVGMAERAELIGARLRIDSAPGQGTRLHLSWRKDQET